jgi:hypothetical protein
MAALTVVCKENLTDGNTGFSMQRDCHRWMAALNLVCRVRVTDAELDLVCETVTDLSTGFCMLRDSQRWQLWIECGDSQW